MLLLLSLFLIVLFNSKFLNRMNYTFNSTNTDFNKHEKIGEKIVVKEKVETGKV